MVLIQEIFLYLRKKKYEVLIVDEAHRLNRRKNLANYGIFDKVNQHFGLGNDGDQLDWISKSADKICINCGNPLKRKLQRRHP